MASASTPPISAMPKEMSNNFNTVSEVSACSKIMFMLPNLWKKRSKKPGESSSGCARTLSFRPDFLGGGVDFSGEQAQPVFDAVYGLVAHQQGAAPGRSTSRLETRRRRLICNR